MAKVYVIRQLPTGSTAAIRAERENLQASKWMVPGVPGGEAVAGKVYQVDEGVAANLVRKGWTLCDAAGKPTGGEAPKIKDEIRAGTEEWMKLPPDKRFGTPEFREAEMNRRLHEAWEKEHPAEVAPVPPGAVESALPEAQQQPNDLGGGVAQVETGQPDTSAGRRNAK